MHVFGAVKYNQASYLVTAQVNSSVLWWCKGNDIQPSESCSNNFQKLTLRETCLLLTVTCFPPAPLQLSH